MADERAPYPDVEAPLLLLRGLEERLLMPGVRSSREETAALLADGFVEFGRSGQIYDRQQTIEALAGEPGDEAPIERTASHFRVSRLSEDVALLTYRSTRRGVADVAHSLRSSVWKRSNGRWQMVFHQGTPTDRLS